MLFFHLVGVWCPGRCLRRSHALAAEDDLGDLGADPGVVDDEGDLSCRAFCQRLHPRVCPGISVSGCRVWHVLSTKPIRRPVRPPTLPRALLTPLAAPAMAGPAALVTRLRPWDALEEASEAVSFAAWAAFSVVVDWKRAPKRACLRADDRIMGRIATADIVSVVGGWERPETREGTEKTEGSSRSRLRGRAPEEVGGRGFGGRPIDA